MVLFTRKGSERKIAVGLDVRVRMISDRDRARETTLRTVAAEAGDQRGGISAVAAGATDALRDDAVRSEPLRVNKTIVDHDDVAAVAADATTAAAAHNAPAIAAVAG